MCGVLLHYEEEIHKIGWDKDPQLVALAGPGLDPTHWTIEALMSDPWFWQLGQHPREVVRAFADFITAPELGSERFGPVVASRMAGNRDAIVNGLADGPLHALVFVCESYSMVTTSDEERHQYRSIGDNPNAHETRNVIAVAPDSTVYLLNRIRGREPYVTWTNHRTGASGSVNGTFMPEELAGRTSFAKGGGVTRSMRRIVNVINARAGLPLIKHVRDRCNQCGTTMPPKRPGGDVLVATCPKCGNGG